MKDPKYLFFYSLGLLRRYRSFLALAALFCLFGYLIFAIWVNRNPYKTVSQGIVGTHTEKDLPPAITNLLSRGLVKIDEAGIVKEDLARSWEVSEDAKKYVIHLNENLHWSDGARVIASDLYFSIPGAEYKVENESTIVFTLAESYSPFLSLLAKPVFRNQTLVGVGPYEIEQIDFDPQNKVFVTAMTVKPLENKVLPRVIFRFYGNDKIARSALKIGDIQSIVGIQEYEDLLKDKPIGYIAAPTRLKMVIIFYNTRDPALSDENLRLALSFAAPAIRGEHEAKGPIPEKSWAYNPLIKDYLDNETQAKLYLAKIGKDSPSGKLVSKDGNEQLIITTTSSLRGTGERVAEAWNKLGLRTSVRVESGIPQNFQALLIIQDLPADPTDQYSLWHSTQLKTNISKFSSVRVDKDLEDARKTTDMDIRKARYADFQKILMDESPATFLYYPKVNAVYYKKIEQDIKKLLEIQFGG